MASELPSQSGDSKVIDGVSELVDRRIDGIDLGTLNTVAAVSLGIRVGLDAITQVLRGGSGPLGPKVER